MLIPPQRLSEDALQALIEEFVSREGTDYGAEEIHFSSKVEQVKQQLYAGDSVIVFDAATESSNLMTREQYREWAAEP